MGKKKILLIILGIVFAIILLLIIGSRNYWFSVVRIKNKAPERFAIIPDSLPEGVTSWKKSFIPDIMQGTGHLSVTVKCTDEYIEQVVDTYEGHAIKAFYGYMWEDDIGSDRLYPMIVTDAGMMYVSSEYDENDRFNHPMYKFDYQKDDVSNIRFYDSSDDLIYDDDGDIDYDKIHVHELAALPISNGREGLIYYVVYYNDDSDCPRIQYVMVDRENNEVTYYAE